MHAHPGVHSGTQLAGPQSCSGGGAAQFPQRVRWPADRNASAMATRSGLCFGACLGGLPGL
jgi:hypothetical protein